MYYQLFIQRQVSSPKFQISCDNWNEVQEEIIRLGNPRLVEVHYYDETGLVGVAKKMYLSLKECYKTYFKKSVK